MAGKPMASSDLERENAELREENERLRAEVADLSTASREKAGGRTKPTVPSFGISEGTRAELEQNGKATDPFTGKTLTREAGELVDGWQADRKKRGHGEVDFSDGTK